jgi:hypothetical protein
VTAREWQKIQIAYDVVYFLKSDSAFVVWRCEHPDHYYEINGASAHVWLCLAQRMPLSEALRLRRGHSKETSSRKQNDDASSALLRVVANFKSLHLIRK